MAAVLITSELEAQNTAPLASSPAIIGEIIPGLTIWATYVYFDADGDEEGDTEIQWFTSPAPDGTDSTEIALATEKSYKVKDSDAGSYIGFRVIPVDSHGESGDTVLTPVFSEIGPNNAPMANVSAITGTLNVGDVLTGHYTYSDYEGDIESGSLLKWYRKLLSAASWSEAGTGISYKISTGDQRMYFRFGVVPKSATGTDSYTEYLSGSYGPANSAPYATNVYISGTGVVSQPLTGHYDWHDDDPADNEGDTQFRWYRGGVLISGAESEEYVPGYDDVGEELVFSVIPVTQGAGNPVTGDEVASSPYGPVIDPSSSSPVASQLCIDGSMVQDYQLKGRYLYSNTYNEKNSKYIWYVDGVVAETGTYSSSYGYARYTLKETDIGKNIRFAVIPQNKLGEKGDTAFSLSMALFTLPLRDNFSVTDPPEVLAANYGGGVFSGPGQSVSGNYFYPANLASSDDPYILSYILPVHYDSIQCTQTTWKKVWVRPVVMTFSGLEAFYCDNTGTDIVTVNNVPAGATDCTFSITSPAGVPVPVTKLNDFTAEFSPDAFDPGAGYTMTYSCRDMLGSTQTINQKFTVDHIGEVKIKNLSADTSFCGNVEPFQLYTSREGGVFTGPVNGSGQFDVSLIPGGYGNTVVTYRVTSALGCFVEDVVPVTVFPVPQISFAPEDYCITDVDSDTTRMINSTVSADPVKSWLWEFSESGLITTDTAREASFLYRSGGFHKIYLTATTVNECSVREEATFDIGVKPVADFTWKNECFHPDSSVYFYDATITTSLITSRSWNFFDGDSLRTVRNPVYPQKSEGYLPVLYIVTTGYAGCGDSIYREVYIRPTISLAADGYFEDFEEGNSHWVPGYETVNNWKFGTPDRQDISRAFSGINAWFTGFRTDTTVFESSTVVSPCFDFTGIERPMISLNTWKSLEKDRQGAALQYKIGDTGNWEYVGTLFDGIRWYNSALIKGRPGGEQIGWTTDPNADPDTSFVNSRHKLDELGGQKDVKFRIAYGSDGTTTGYDGLAFDDIWIGPRSRHVLLEHFTNTFSSPGSTATAMVDTVYKYNSDDVIYIQYHTNFPGPDPFYTDNQGDAGGRMLYYGLSRVPYSFLDGGSDRENFASLYDYSISKIDANEVARRSLMNTKFDISLTADVTEGVLTVEGMIRALDDVSAENMTLYIAVTEKENDEHTGANGETKFLNVFRKMIPDAGGTDLKKEWVKDESFTIQPISWMTENIRDNSMIEVIAFLQNNVTRTVYQASSVRDINIGVGINDMKNNGSPGFALYPNPAVNKLTIDFREPLTTDAVVRIHNLQGKLVCEYIAGSGSTEFVIDNLSLKQGIYLVRVSSDGAGMGSRKLVVTDR
ncbi:MAG: T9SS type A sorting domain-containing protein [Bacteroidales bacterium]|nr:T9SS type A sorting domain-containing protein [Bacteroidales bacterium]